MTIIECLIGWLASIMAMLGFLALTTYPDINWFMQFFCMCCGLISGAFMFGFAGIFIIKVFCFLF